MKQKKRYIVTGCLPEQAKYKTLSRLRVDRLNGYRLTQKGWSIYWNPTQPNHFTSPNEVETMAKKHKCEMAQDCFYVPEGTIFHVPKGGFSHGIRLRHYAVDNPEMGGFTVYINPENIVPLEFEEI